MTHAHPHAGPPGGPGRFREFKTYVREEVIAHLPFTLFGMLAGLLVVIFTGRFAVKFGEEEFHLAHFVHVFFSAAAGAAVFRSYRDSLWKGIPVVFVSSVSLCTLSDSLIPYWGLRIFGKGAAAHICFVEHPFLVSSFAAAGFVLGVVGIRFFRHCNRGFHLAHLLISTAASVLYMIAFAASVSVRDMAAVLATIFVSLAVPCLVGDVALPLCFVKMREEYLHERVHHS